MNQRASGRRTLSCLRIDDQVEIALPVPTRLLSPPRPWNFSGSGRSALEIRRMFFACSRQLPLVGLEQRALDTDDVAGGPMLEFLVLLLAGQVRSTRRPGSGRSVLATRPRSLAHRAPYNIMRPAMRQRRGFSARRLLGFFCMRFIQSGKPDPRLLEVVLG